MQKIVSSAICGLLMLFTFNTSGFAAKMTAKEKAQFSTPFPMLTFEQIARLEFTQRIKYVREFRRIALEIEKAQFMFKGTLSADARIIDPRDKNRLYAYLFGDFADAADTTDHTRGADISDRCIYGYNLSKYPTDPAGARKPFGCEIPAAARCVGANGAGVQCGYYMSGLNGAVDRACIPDAVRYKATTECNVVRTQLTKENPARINGAVDNAEKYFGFQKAGSKISKDDMTNDKAAQILKDLADTAYDDRAYAELIYVLSFYKKSGVKIPLNILGAQYENIQPELFEKNINSLQAAVNQVFGDYINHCSRKLDDSVVANLRDPKWLNTAEQKGRAAWIQEKRRAEAVANLDKISGSDYRVDSVLQIPECKAIYARRDSIRDNLIKIIGSYPELSDDAPATEPTVPVAPPKDEYTIKSTGCSNSVVAEEHQLYQSAARCVACQADRDMAKSAKDAASDEEKQRRQYYSVSTKWLSLMSSMALACGDGTSNDSHVTPELMLQYMHTFGHCSADTYEWDPSGPSEEDKRLIEEWSDHELWTNKKKGAKPDADINKDFARIYGISYETSTKLFCDPKRFKTGWFTNKIKKRNDDYFPPAANVRMAQSRTQFNDLLSGKSLKRVKVSPDNYKNDSVADALYDCMHESNQFAKERYSGSGASCTGTVKFNGPGYSRGAFEQMLSEVKGEGTALVFNNTDCFVAKQYELDDKKSKNDKRESIGFVDPRGLGNSYARVSYFGDGERPVLSGFPQFDSAGEAKDGRNRAPINISKENLSSWSFTVPSNSECLAAAAGSDGSKGSKKAK